MKNTLMHVKKAMQNKHYLRKTPIYIYLKSHTWFPKFAFLN